jgi:hypothetical protein
VAFAVGSFVVQRREPPRLGLVAAGAVLGAGLAAFYVMPAIVELDQVQTGRLIRADFDYRLHFVRPEWWFDWSWRYGGSGLDATDRLSLQIGIVQWIVIVAGVIALTVPAVRRRASSKLLSIAGWLLVVGGALFMMTAASAGVWARIGPLAYIQFPWRILMIPALACAALAATLLSTVRSRTTQALIVVCIVTCQWYLTNDYRESAALRERGKIAIDDPAWRATATARRWAFREGGYDPVSVTDREPRPLPYERWTLAAGIADVSTIATTDTTVGLMVRASEPVRLRINSPFFAGWRISVDDQPVLPDVRPDTGYMEITVQAGLHRVDAVFGRSRVRWIAELITLASMIVWLFVLAWNSIRRRSVQ